jgi:hypothetical protein
MIESVEDATFAKNVIQVLRSIRDEIHYLNVGIDEIKKEIVLLRATRT